MRLIDAEKLFEDLFVNNGKLCPDKDVDNFPITINVKDVKKAISKQPTACDVDAVVSELGKASCIARPVGWSAKKEIVELKTAIEIVKGGGVFTCCGDCVHYDRKKHKCKCGHDKESNAQEHFYDDCTTMDDLEKYEKMAYSKAVDDMVNTLIRNSRTEEIDGNICLIVTDKRIKLIAEQLKEGAGE